MKRERKVTLIFFLTRWQILFVCIYLYIYYLIQRKSMVCYFLSSFFEVLYLGNILFKYSKSWLIIDNTYSSLYYPLILFNLIINIHIKFSFYIFHSFFNFLNAFSQIFIFQKISYSFIALFLGFCFLSIISPHLIIVFFYFI